MTLARRLIRHPVPRNRVEMNALVLLAAVATGLPREHGAGLAERTGGASGRVDTPVPVEEKGSADLGRAQAEGPQHEDLVPEDVTPVGLAVQSARRHADIKVDGV